MSLEQRLAELANVVRQHRLGEKIQGCVGRAEFLIDRARRDGASLEQLARYDELLKSIKGEGHADQREALQLRWDIFGRPKQSVAAKANVATAIAALTSDNHWAAEEYRASLLAIAEKNGRIPGAYKPQLRHDLATVLQMCPHAGGLVRELTMRGQRGATGSASKLGSKSNAAVGAAYEIMGTAALAKMVSKPSNVSAPDLHIQLGRDWVTFGDKSYMNRRSEDGSTWRGPSRHSIECDLRIARPTLDGIREIGVDFKHTKEMGVKSASADLRNQLQNVVWAIKEGQLHEYHFATNGTFGPSFREAVQAVNTELVGRGETPIGLHEHVTTLLNDPSALPD